MAQKIRVIYYALLRQERGLSEEYFSCSASTAQELFNQLKALHSFSLSTEQVRVAINSKVSSWEAPLNEGDTLLFMPPVAGG